jgi:hypothetical protein
MRVFIEWREKTRHERICNSLGPAVEIDKERPQGVHDGPLLALAGAKRESSLGCRNSQPSLIIALQCLSN